MRLFSPVVRYADILDSISIELALCWEPIPRLCLWFELIVCFASFCIRCDSGSRRPWVTATLCVHWPPYRRSTTSTCCRSSWEPWCLERSTAMSPSSWRESAFRRTGSSWQLDVTTSGTFKCLSSASWHLCLVIFVFDRSFGKLPPPVSTACSESCWIHITKYTLKHKCQTCLCSSFLIVRICRFSSCYPFQYQLICYIFFFYQFSTLKVESIKCLCEMRIIISKSLKWRVNVVSLSSKQCKTQTFCLF